MRTAGSSFFFDVRTKVGPSIRLNFSILASDPINLRLHTKRRICDTLAARQLTSEIDIVVMQHPNPIIINDTAEEEECKF